MLVFVRALVLYLLVVIVMRIMGKRQIGELQPFELVVAIMIAELASVPMQDTAVPLINGIISIITLLFAQVMLSFISLKSVRARKIICGTPSVLIENGRIVEQQLRKERYNINDLLEQLRAANMPNIADVEFAILETSGQLSVIPKSQKRTVTPQDLNIETQYEGLPTTLIIDGKVIHSNLKKINLSVNWLKEELQKCGIKDTKKVLFASIDTSGQLYCQQKSLKE
ncbi:MAG TPA: DUF421 domain-containing protein [Clostridiales bacterium]|nr:DUF421 domain-containing protein [Clostridiales bacterium]